MIFVLGILLLVSASCKKTTNSISSSSYTPDCSGTAKSYKTDVAPLLTNNCVGCHSQFSTYASVSASTSSIRSNIVSGNMPKSGTLTFAQKNAIVCWIDNGAPNN